MPLLEAVNLLELLFVIAGKIGIFSNKRTQRCSHPIRSFEAGEEAGEMLEIPLCDVMLGSFLYIVDIIYILTPSFLYIVDVIYVLTIALHFMLMWHTFFEFTGIHVDVGSIVHVNTPIKYKRSYYILHIYLGVIYQGWMMCYIEFSMSTKSCLVNFPSYFAHPRKIKNV